MFILWIFLLYLIIGVTWQIAEKLIYKKVTPRIIDDFIAVALAILLYLTFW